MTEHADIDPEFEQYRDPSVDGGQDGAGAVTETTACRCQAESLDGHEHAGDAIEYVGICVRGHERRGLVCSACTRCQRERGPAAVRCAECPEDDPRPRVLIPADMWDDAVAGEER
jgi:hypothetical protein